MKKLILTLAALAALPLLAADFPAGSPKFLTSHDAALKEAEKTGKPVILVFSAVWCPPCQAMKKSVYPSKEVKPFHDKFVWAYLDTDVESNGAAAGKYGVEGIPHIQFLDSKGKPIDKQVGSSSPDAFAKTLQSVAKKSAKS